MAIGRRLSALVAAALLLGCEGGPFGLSERYELTRAEQQWAAAAVTGYSYTLREACFMCLANSVRVTVRGDSVVSVVVLPGPMPGPIGGDLPSYTIPQLFEHARGVLTTRGIRSTVVFDDVLGYPREISSSTPNTMDSGYVLLASDVVFEDH